MKTGAKRSFFDLDYLLDRFSETFLGKGLATIFGVFLVLFFLTGVGIYFFAPATTARNGSIAVTITSLGVIVAFILGYIKRSKRQFSYGWCEVVAGMGWTGVQIAYFLNDPPGQPIFVSRFLFLLAGVYLLRRGVDNILDGAEKLKRKGASEG